MRTMKVFTRQVNFAKFMRKKKLILEIARAMIEYDWSCRTLAKNFEVSKSSVHRWLMHELPYLDDDLFVQCKNILNKHRHAGRPKK